MTDTDAAPFACMECGRGIGQPGVCMWCCDPYCIRCGRKLLIAEATYCSPWCETPGAWLV